MRGRRLECGNGRKGLSRASHIGPRRAGCTTLSSVLTRPSGKRGLSMQSAEERKCKTKKKKKREKQNEIICLLKAETSGKDVATSSVTVQAVQLCGPASECQYFSLGRSRHFARLCAVQRGREKTEMVHFTRLLAKGREVLFAPYS